jgi:FkbM family methyltransferase
MVVYSNYTSKGVPIENIIDDLFSGKENGFFIELGANDGLAQSNTAFLEFTRKWRGILIEPSVNAYTSCVNNRPGSICVNAACVSDTYGDATISGDFNGGLMSSVNGERCRQPANVTIPAMTLEAILDTYGAPLELDFLSVDAEGYELNILKGLRLKKYRPLCILIEIYKNQYDDIYSFMLTNGYMLHSNVTEYNHVDNRGWDGTHNDYLFVRM